jgi:hypothetical protein
MASPPARAPVQPHAGRAVATGKVSRACDLIASSACDCWGVLLHVASGITGGFTGRQPVTSARHSPGSILGIGTVLLPRLNNCKPDMLHPASPVLTKVDIALLAPPS